METITNKEIICIAHFQAKKGQKDMLLKVLQQLIKPSKAELGCISYQLHSSPENPDLFTFIDKFKDQEAFDYHCETAHVKETFDNLIPPLVETMTITLHHEI
ncbi:MAG: antibiotic biosynthesis monooxygenase [Tatlockia sp.]|nr:antibiotic biosynthesis monooxygenase [Tatlockia sp.]